MKPYFETENGKLYHGDCLEILPELEPVDLVLTDPPYGIDYQSAWRTDRAQWKSKIANDINPFIEWLPDSFKKTTNGGRLFCFCRWDVEAVFSEGIQDAGYSIKSQIIWDKVVHGMGDLQGSFAPCHENALYATKGTFKFQGKRPKSILRYSRVPAESLLHPNEKPVHLIRDLIVSLSHPEDKTLDPFFGSGTTGVACEELGRKWIGIEISEKYCEIAARRIEKETQQLRLFA